VLATLLAWSLVPSVKAANGAAGVSGTAAAVCASRNEAIKRKENAAMANVVQADQPKLFYVISTESVNGFDHVPVTWFADRCMDGVEMPWPTLIENYSPQPTGLGYTQAALREMFTEPEAEAVVEHLRKTGDGAGAPTLEPVQLPVRSLLPLSENAFDGDVTFPLSNTGFPFPVRGYCKLIDRLLIRKEKNGGFVIYWNERPISRPFADRAAAEAWQKRVLPLRDIYQWPLAR
jgi:hypothetical protein